MMKLKKKYNYICSRNMVFKSKNGSKTKFHTNGLLATLSSNFQEGQIRNTIIKQKLNVARSVLEDVKTEQLQRYGHVQRMEEGRLPKEVMKWRPPGGRKRFNGTDMSKEWKRGDCQKKL
jgi:hypothetical protein